MDYNLDTLITPEVRTAILSNGEAFVTALNEALNPLGVTYIKGKSISSCCKLSEQYVEAGKRKGGQTQFMNRVKSILKAHKVGEHMTLEAIARGFWAQFNGTTADKDASGNPTTVKKVNISFVRGDIKASKEDDTVATETLAKETKKAQAALEFFKSKYNVSDAELANAIAVAGNVVE
jgi:hypothetical protein